MSALLNVVSSRKDGGSSQQPRMFLAREMRVEYRRYGPGLAQKRALSSTFSMNDVLPEFFACRHVAMNLKYLKYKKRLDGRFGVREYKLLPIKIL